MSIRMLPLKGQGPGQGTAQDTTPPLDPNYHHNSKFSFDKLQMRMSGRKTLRRRHSSLADCDIVKKGTLHMKRPPKSLKIRLKTWQTRYFVLRDDSYDQGCRLEIYPNETNWEEGRHADRINIDLRQVSHIEEYRESRSFPFSFTVTRRGQSPLILGTSCEAEMREWVVAVQLLVCKTFSKMTSPLTNISSGIKNGLSLSLSLNDSLVTLGSRNNVLNSSFDSATSSYHSGMIKSRPTSVSVPTSCPPTPGKDSRKWGYHVEVLPSGGAQRNRLSGDYRMQVVADCIVLRRLDVDMEIIRWGLVHIRQFKAEEVKAEPGQEVVTLEANIHCGHREGTYLFKTPYGRELIARVREAVRLMSVRRTLGNQARETPSPRSTLTRFGLRHKSESEPALETRRSPTPPCSLTGRQWSRDSSPDCPPRQMAPIPDVAGDSHHGNGHQGSPPSLDRSSRDSSPENDDDPPPPYLEVLAGDEDIIPGVPPLPLVYPGDECKCCRLEKSDSCENNDDYGPKRPSLEADDSNLISSNPMHCRRMMSCRASIDSCPDVPPPPPPRPKHTLQKDSAVDIKSQLDTYSVTSNGSLPPPLPPRDF